MEIHEFVKDELCPRVKDCPSTEMFSTLLAWQNHLWSKHSGETMPGKVCPIENYSQIFDLYRNFNIHLGLNHGLRGARYDASKLDKDGRTKAEQQADEAV